MTKPYAYPAAALIELAAIGGDRNYLEVLRRLSEMTQDERQLLQRALERLSNALDADALERHLKRSRNGRK